VSISNVSSSSSVKRSRMNTPTRSSRPLVAKMGLELQPLLAAGGLPIDVAAGARFDTFRRQVDVR
jgi:hypothetical protein